MGDFPSVMRSQGLQSPLSPVLRQSLPPGQAGIDRALNSIRLPSVPQILFTPVWISLFNRGPNGDREGLEPRGPGAALRIGQSGT